MSRTETLCATKRRWPKRSINILRYVVILIAFSPVTVVFQNCSKGFQATTSPSLNSLSSTSDGQCTPGMVAGCSVANGTGTMKCNSAGNGYDQCNPTSCNVGYNLSSGACVSNACTPNSTMSCSGNNGMGTQTCDSTGAAWGPCVLNSCNTNYVLQGGTCAFSGCKPSSIASCNVAGAYGIKTCNAQGTAYGACVLDNCSPFGQDYYPLNGVCVKGGPVCIPNITYAEMYYPNAPVNQAATDCQDIFTSGPAWFDAAGFVQTCNSTGTAWGPCTVTSCIIGTELQNGQCVSAGISCTPGKSFSCDGVNGTGTGVCNSQGTGFISCTLNACNFGYTLQNGVCVQDNCKPNTVISCSANNGTGDQTCNAQGTGYGACELSACNSGYTAQVSSSGNISCVGICTPGSSQYCSINNGSGSEVCNAQGNGFGQCALTSCLSGYNLQNGSCVKDLCDPYSTQSCDFKPNANGSQECNSTGTAWSSCAFKSCQPGFVWTYTNIKDEGNTNNYSCLQDSSCGLVGNPFSATVTPGGTTSSGAPYTTTLTFVQYSCNGTIIDVGGTPTSGSPTGSGFTFVGNTYYPNTVRILSSTVSSGERYCLTSFPVSALGNNTFWSIDYTYGCH